MKRVILLVAALLLAHLQYAQDCTPSAPPYLEDFETVTAPAVPNCLATIGTGFTTVNNPGNGFTSNTLKYTGGAQASDAWLFTKGVVLQAGTPYRINYKYGNLGTDVQTAQFGYSMNNDGTSFSITGGQVNVSDGTLHSANFSYFQAPQTGTYYFGYHITSAAGTGSLLIDNISIEPSTCGIPGFLNTSAVTQTGVTLTWEASITGNVSPIGIYQYVVSTSPAVPASGTANYSLNKTVTGLLPGTTYYVFVRSQCASVWSDWATTTFTTLPCDAVAAPYSLDFESATVPAAPECTSAPVPPTGNGWVTANNPGNGFTDNTLVYNGTAAAANAWFFTRGVQLTAGTYYQISYKYGNNSTTTTEKLSVARFTSPDPASASSSIGNYTINSGQPQDVLLNFVTVPVSGIYYFGFNAHSDASQGSLYVDDFSVEPSLCGTPANVTVVPGQTTATFNWGVPTTGNAMVNVYQYAWGTTTTPPAEGQYTIALTAETTALQPATSYYAFTRALCGQIWSDWTITPFNTLPDCEAATAPYALNFDAVTTPAIPQCTYVPAAATGNNNWVTTNNPGNGFSSNALVYNSTANAADAWFFTQGVQLTAGTYYQISYKYGNNSSTTTEKLKVTWATSPSPTAIALNTTEYVVTGGEAQTALLNFVTVPVSGIYYFGFNAHSDASQGSLYVDDFSVEPSLCGTSANVTITPGQTTATFNWGVPTTGNAMVNVYQYAWGTTTTPPAEGQYTIALTAETTALQPATSYYAFTRALCGQIWSDWTITPFNTLPDCEAATVPYTIDFEAATTPALPTCTYTPATAIGHNNWVTASNPGSGFTTKALSYTGTADAANAWFFTQGIQLTAGQRYKVSFTYGNSSAATTEKLFVNVFTAQNSTATIQDFLGSEYTVNTGQPATQVNDYVTIPTTGVYYFGFNAHSDASQGSLYIDNFSIVESVCGQPADITVTGISQAGATVNWAIPTTGNSPVNVYQYAYGTTDIPPAQGEYIPALTKEITGLTAGTTYYVFTRSACGPLFSDWTVTPFTTLPCDAVNVPYTLDFETTFVPAIPDCTYTVAVGDGNNNWVTANNPGNGFTSNTLSYTATANTANAWFFTSGVQLEAGKHYKVSFTYGNNSATTTEKLFVNQYSAPNSTATIPGFAGSEYTVTAGQPSTQVNDYVTVPTTGVYYFGFNAHSDASQGSLYIDDFSIVESVCGEPADVTVDNISQTGATLNWAIPNTGNSPVNVYQYAYGTTDTPPAEGEFISELTKDLTGLTPGTDYYVFTRSLCGQIFSDWTVTPFTTLDETAGLDDYTLNSLKVYPNPTKDVVRIANSSTIDKVDIYNITGQLVHSQAINSQEAEINLQHLAAGAYFMNVQANGAVKKVKVIKQ